MQRTTRKYCSWEDVPVVLNVNDACVLLGMSVQTVKKYLNSGELKGKKTGKDWLIPKESVRVFLGLPNLTH